VKTKIQLILLTAGILLLTATLNAQETDPSIQLEQDNADAIQSIQAYWQYRGDAPEDGLITIPEGDWIPDANDPEWAGLDFAGYQSWVETNDPDNAWWLVENIMFWQEEDDLMSQTFSTEACQNDAAEIGVQLIALYYEEFSGQIPIGGNGIFDPVNFEKPWEDLDLMELDLGLFENWAFGQNMLDPECVEDGVQWVIDRLKEVIPKKVTLTATTKDTSAFGDNGKYSSQWVLTNPIEGVIVQNGIIGWILA
jgi:hypothetical protein